MDRDQLRQGVAKVWLYAKCIGIGDIFACPTSLRASSSFKEVALNASAHYEEVYLTGLQGAEYNILLADYSYFQFTLDSVGEARYGFYPNPFIGASREAMHELSTLRAMVDAGGMDVDEYLQAVSEVRVARHPPLVRYENAPSQYRKLSHPCSHIHFGHHGENRWPVKRILTPQAFGLAIFKQFYGDFWLAEKTVRVQDRDITMEEIFALAKSDCRILGEELFSREEDRQLHFG